MGGAFAIHDISIKQINRSIFFSGGFIFIVLKCHLTSNNQFSCYLGIFSSCMHKVSAGT